MNKLRFFITLVIAFLSFSLSNAQTSDDFSDGDFSANPAWTGDAAEFVVNAQEELQLNASLAGTSSLSLPFSSVLNTEWRLKLKQSFAPSANNYSRFYLIADDDSLENPALNGYFLQFGENGSLDAVELFRQNGAATVSIARGTDGTIAASFTVGIKVTCDNTGLWSIFVDPAGGSAYQLQATGTDASISTGLAAGWLCKYTVSNITNFFLDDVYLGPPVVDLTPPAILSATALSATQIDVLFTEPLDQSSSENVLNYSVNNGIGQPITAQRDAVNLALVHLSVNSLTNGQSYLLSCSNVSDLASNVIASGASASFSYIVPASSGFGDVIINEIMADPTPQVSLPNAEFIEIHNRTTSSFDLANWTISDGSSTGTLPGFILSPGSYLILSSTTNAPLFSPYGNVLGVPSFPSINNTGEVLILSNASGLVIDSVRFDLNWYQDAIKADGGWTLELINTTLPSNCAGASNWIASFNSNGGTPGSQNSVWTNTPDIQNPALVSVSVLNANLLQVCFSEPLSPSIAFNVSTWTVAGGGNPSSITTAGNCLLLSFSTPFQQGQNYTLNYAQLEDCSGNTLASGSSPFSYSLAQAFDVVITEIFADPTPQVALPPLEFLEIHNTQSVDLALNGWTISIGTNDYVIPAVTIPADSFLVLCAVSAVPDFITYGIAVGVPGMNSTSLTNAGTTLSLKNDAGLLIYSVTYSDQWYNDPVKAAGGWSLEIIDPANPCAGSSNWTSSVNPDGGTPGRRNSVLASNPDTEAPTLASVRVLNSNNLEVLFSESITNASSLLATDFSVSGGIGQAASISTLGSPVNGIILGFSNALNPGQIYVLSGAAPLVDCSGNTSSQNQSISFSTYEAQVHDVVINEIMADPDPAVGLPPFEYVELHNTTSFPINVFNWKLVIGTTVRTLPSATLAPDGYLILCAPAASAGLQAFGNVASLPSLSTSALTNTGTVLSLVDTANRMIHSVSYSDNWYADASKDDGGWSLEQIDPLNPCGDRKNWKASASTFGGTPGAINSVNAPNPDLVAPSVVAVCPISANILEVKFSEILDSALISDPSRFSVTGVGSPASVQLGTLPYRSVNLSFSQPFQPSQNYTLTVDGTIQDCAGNAFSSSGLADFYLGVVDPYQIQINELMADPDPAVGLPSVEYVELYNTLSRTVNLRDWRFQIGSSSLSLGCFSIPPNGYLVFTTDGSDDRVFPSSFALDGFSGLTNSGTSVSLSDYFGKIISQVSFSDSWYQNSAKQDGGWSLEQIDPANPCGGSDNWLASRDSSGGTPGLINSVNAPNPDAMSPMVASALWIDSVQVELRFAEPMQLISLLNPESYLVLPGNISPAIVTPQAPAFQSVILRFLNPLAENQIYTVKVSPRVYDCAGNSVSAFDSARFGKPVPAEPGDLIINEIMYYPKDGSGDFIEVYNKSSKVIELNDLRIANWDTINNMALNAGNPAPIKYQILPGQYLSVTESAKKVNDFYYSLNPLWFSETDELPSFNASGGTVALVKNDGSLIDYAVFSPDMHFPLLNDTKGISLERISMDRPSEDLSNWTSASFQVGFATPSYKNSQAGEIKSADGTLTLSSEIFSPDNDGYQDVLQVSYSLGFPAGAGSAMIFDAKGREVATLFRNRLLGPEGVFSWDGTTNSNLKADMGIYVLFFEYFDQNGNQKRLKKAVVLGGRI